MIEHKNTSLAIKCIKQSYDSPNELVSMMETFRQMVKLASRLALKTTVPH
ncbi:MAG: hypothetical protein KGI05_09560 [Thaumarchaeota archaeon]|nr:hypothetical protein [Nitrososphaerota archaeon]